MTKRHLAVILLSCLALAVVATSAFAQNKKIGTATASELLIPVGARDLAMGGSSIANTYGAEAMYWNPAGVARMKHSAEGMFSSMNYIADIGVTYGAAAGQFGEFGAIGLSVKSLSFGDIPLTTEDDPENFTGRLFSPAYVTIGITYSRPLTDAIAIGTTVKIISETIDQVSASGFAFDFGVMYNGLIGVKGFNLGLVVKNIGPQMKFDGPGMYRVATSSDGRRPEQRYKSEAASFELPSVVEIGLAYEGKASDNLLWNVSGSFTNNNLYMDEYRVGGEIGFTMESLQLFGRAGVGIVPQAAEKENIFGPTLGAGVAYLSPGISVTLDYAYRQVEFFSANNVISLKLGF